MRVSEEWLRLKQLTSLIGIFGYHNLHRHLGHRLDPEGVMCHRVSQLASRRALDYLQMQVTTRGLEHVNGLENFCVVSNHASYLDWALLLAHFPAPLRFIAKSELMRMPIIGAFLRDRGVLIDRSRGVDAKTAIRNAVNDGQPYPIMIFPEGTRSHDGTVQPFKRGGLRILAEAGRTFVPVSLRGTHGALPRRGRTARTGAQLELIVGPPLHPADFDSADDLIAVCESRIKRMTRGEEPPAPQRVEQPKPAEQAATGNESFDWSPPRAHQLRQDQLSS